VRSYLQVYKVLGPNLRLFALKVVTLKGHNSKELVRGFQQEFEKLRSLKDSPGVINVYSIEEFPEEKMLLMCLELGDIDLATLLTNKRKRWEAQGISDPFVADPTFIAALWHDMLRAVQVPALFQTCMIMLTGAYMCLKDVSSVQGAGCK
jgi:serine/threonine protein kinase